MEFATVTFVNWKRRMFIPVFAVFVSLMLVVSGERTMDTEYDSNGDAIHDFKSLWDIYIFPRLQFDLNSKVSQWLEEKQKDRDPSTRDYFSDQPNPVQTEQQPPRFKRIGVAGLENLDIMTKMLDQNQQGHLPMSVSNMNSNKLRQLMMSVGRKRK